MPPALASPGFGWHETALGTCASLVRESVSPSECGSLPYIGLEHIGQGTLGLLGTGTAQDVESTKAAFRTGDILFGKLRPYFRKVVRTRFDGICSTDIWVVRPRQGVDAGYLFYLLASNLFIDFANQGAEGTRMPRAKWQQVSRFPVRLPPIAEQRAIAQVLGAFDDKVEVNRRMVETLEEATSALFKSWFVNFDPVQAQMSGSSVELAPKVSCLFPSRLVKSDIGLIPEGWRVSLLGELMEFAYGKALRSNERRGGDIPVYGSNGQIGWHDRKMVDGPGVVVGRKGNPGVVTWSQGSFFPIDTTFYVVPKEHRKVSLRFLFYALRNQNLPSIAADSAVPGLNRNIAYMSPQLVPSAHIMEAFDSHTDSMLSRRDQLGVESRSLANLRDTLLPKLLSGEIHIRDAEKIAEAAT